MVALIVVAVLVVVALAIAAKTIRIIPQARAAVLERLGRYHRTLDAGADLHHAVRRPRAAADRPARAGRQLLARSR